MDPQIKSQQKGYIKITPFDGLFFGKGRPFDAGDDSWTEADLLPSPQVIWGALFSQLWYSTPETARKSLIEKKGYFRLGASMFIILTQYGFALAPFGGEALEI